MMRKTLTGILGTALLAGCQTAHVTERSYRELDEKQTAQLTQVADLKSPSRSYRDLAIKDDSVATRGLPYGATQEVISRYSDMLPRARFNLYIPRMENGALVGYDLRPLDTNIMNASADELLLLEESLPQTDSLRLVTSDPSKATLSPMTGRNQFSRADVAGIESFSSDSAKRGFVVGSDVVTGANVTHYTSDSTVTVSFGQPAFEARKKRTDLGDVFPLAVSSGVGYAIAQVPGAVSPVAAYGIEGLAGLIEGYTNPVTPGARLGTNRTVAVGDIDYRTVTVASVLNTAHNLNAHNIVLVPFDGGMGVTYMTKVDGVEARNDGAVVLHVSDEGANFWGSLLYSAAKSGAVAGVIEGFADNDGSGNSPGGNKGSGLTGGQQGSVGGGSPNTGVSGGQQGSVGGVNGGQTGGAGGN